MKNALHLKLNVLVIAISTIWASSMAHGASQVLIARNNVVSSSSLPPVMRLNTKSYLTLNSPMGHALLSDLPEIVIDGGTLEISPSGYDEKIAASRIVISNGGKIVTNGVDLSISALEFKSSFGKIVAFDRRDGLGVAEAGRSGRDGRPGGTLVLQLFLSETERLTIDLSGEDGQDGGRGTSGSPGADGKAGLDAEVIRGPFQKPVCIRPATVGESGSPGAPGGPGGSGGAGGGGGYLVLQGGISQERLGIGFVSLGGRGGIGGKGGEGGIGGKGGPPGNTRSGCGTAAFGPAGENGPIGQEGRKGPYGAAGAIRFGY